MAQDQQTNCRTTQALSSLRRWREQVSTGMDQILPHLFVGALRDAIDVQQLEGNMIRAIVSVHGFTRDCDFIGTKVEDVLRVVLNDSPGENVLKHFSSVNTFIHSHRLRQENVLVHCLAGASRSVCFCVAYLMTVTNLNYTNALDYMSARRYCARPNFGFKMQLMKFGQKFIHAERQRLFSNFIAQNHEEQFLHLYRSDCQFTNTLFVGEAKEVEMHFSHSYLSPDSLSCTTNSNGNGKASQKSVKDGAEQKTSGNEDGNGGDASN